MEQDLDRPNFTVNGVEVENFKEFARIQGMTMQEFLDDLRKKDVIDVSRQTFSNWCSGRHMPSAHKLSDLSDYMDEDIATVYQFFNVAMQQRVARENE